MKSVSPVNVVPAQFVTPSPSAKGIHASREFEASLIASVLQTAEKTFAALPGQDAFAGSENYDYLGAQALGSEIASHGGFGVANMISRYLAAHPDQK